MSLEFKHLPLEGLLLIWPVVFEDDRGYFMETYKASSYTANGIADNFVQDNHSCSRRGVLRGLHFQRPPHSQGKLVQVATGVVWDCAVDIRPDSRTYGQWHGVTLSEENRLMLYIPPGFAHGFVTLSEEAHLLYKCTAEFDKASEGGIRWNDPDLGIEWPLQDITISERDAALPFFKDLA
jgi:dTDP-4-dehydrorhamnose 3,5-epimerase